MANHLNDISKHHPDLVIQVLSKWLNQSTGENTKKILWITHRALRTLIKKGYPPALKLIGVNGRAKADMGEFKIRKKDLKLNEKLSFSFALQSRSRKTQKIVIDYKIHFVKSNGTLSPKVYKLKTLNLKPNETIQISKEHSLKKITTMQYYSGRHYLEIQINGENFGKIPWNFKLPK